MLPLLSFSRFFSSWSNVPLAPPDPILGLNEAFAADPRPEKILLGAGAYRTDEGSPWVLPCVVKAKQSISDSNPNHEYSGIAGAPIFNKLAKELIFADSTSLPVVSQQVLSGTGALRMGAEFIKKYKPNAPVYVSSPTWGNHNQIFNHAGIEVRNYRYYDKSNNSLDLDGMLQDLSDAPDGSILLLQACAHNPTGLDPTLEQWKEISKVSAAKKHYNFFDSAYQGFASGDPDRDIAALRLFADPAQGHEDRICVAQSFAKNFGLYGERIGAFHIVAADDEQATAVASQMKILIRGMYSNPPINGARIIETILQDKEMSKQWREDLITMSSRINSGRQVLVDKLAALGSKHDWSHITGQIGMFCFSGLSPEQVEKMKTKHAVYCTSNGRLSMAGLTSQNVDAVAAAMHDVSK